MQNKALEFVSGDYVWLVDTDEVYKRKDIETIVTMLKRDPSITQINFIGDNFWKGLVYIFVSPLFFEKAAHFRRVFKFQEGAKFTSHRPPTMMLPGADKTTEQMNLISGSKTREMGIYPYHYSYVLDEQVKQKIELYNRYGWGNSWKLDMNLWYKECFLKWTPENREKVETQFPVWTGDKNSYTKLFTGDHPEVMKDYINKKKKNNIKIAGEYAKEKDLTQIDSVSEFALGIKKVIAEIKPAKIIETGTYLGTGTTNIVASALKEMKLTESRFFSIEVNENNHRRAVENIKESNLSEYVTLLHGLSLPRTLLPSIEDIEKSTVQQVEFNDIFVDHKESDRANLYYNETNFEDVDDNLLEKCLISFDYEPDFVLLDSGGHIGNIEFNYLIERLKIDCVIALDDINHIKHRKSFIQIQNDPRFENIVSSEEKFGFCIAKFTPMTDSNIKSIIHETIKKIIFLRIDSIGDSILAASLLQPLKNKFPHASISVICQTHISELYEPNPNVEQVIGINLNQYRDDGNYKKNIDAVLSSLNSDLLI